jgi:hypothetical protein
MPIRRTSNKSSYDSGFYNPEVYSDVGSRRIFEFDPDALTYLDAVEAVDGQALEFDVKVAVNNFVIGCKADGIWTAIKASCILAGARTLSGALVPLVGAAPTNFNFVSGDYNRETGLVGDGSTKYLNSNRNNNADPQNNQHLAVFHSNTASGVSAIASASALGSAGGTELIALPSPQTLSRETIGTVHGGSAVGVGLFGVSRNSSASYTWRATGGAVGGTVTQASSTPHNLNIWVFARNSNGVFDFPTTSRLAFYSIGESLDLALLDTRVTALINDIAAAIP